MKKFLPIGLLASLLIGSAFNAKANIFRCGYPGNPTSIDYNDLQSAHDNANGGDTILLFPYQNWNASFNKKIVLIGCGYFVNTTTNNNSNGVPNNGLQILNQSSSCSLNLDQGSDNSVLEGVDGLSVNLLADNNNTTINGITIDRCNVSITLTEQYYDGVNNCDGITITRSIINQIAAGYRVAGYVIKNFAVSNSVVSNCDLFSGVEPAAGNNGYFANCTFLNSTLNFEGGSYLVQNSIFTGIAQSDNSTSYYNCMYNTDVSSTWIPTGNGNGTGNIGNSFSAKQVFIDYPTSGGGIAPANNYSPDAGLAIVGGSTAKKAGSDGTDLGIYGGTTPYQLSGLAVPAFYKLTSSQGINATTSPYKVTFSVRSHN